MCKNTKIVMKGKFFVDAHYGHLQKIKWEMEKYIGRSFVYVKRWSCFR